MTIFQNGHALLVGVGADLPNTIDDAKGLAGILADGERCAYPPKQVVALTGADAKRDGVLGALDALAARSDANSTVIVFFSGHGYQVASSMAEQYYLMPYKYDLNALVKTAISGKEFADKLKAIPAQRMLVLLDCCHAGGVSEEKSAALQFSKAPLPPEAQSLFAKGSGRVLIASSQADEKSFAGHPYSAFTLAVIEALAGEGAAKKDGYVRWTDLALHSREKVPQRTKNRQHPIIDLEQADNFVLAYYAGGSSQPKGVPFAGTPEIEPEPGAFGDTINAQHSQGFINRPTGHVTQHFGDRVHTGGGAYVGGSVTTGGGDFVGRDRIQQGLSGADLESTKAHVNHGEEYVTIPVFYGTDRKRESLSATTVTYGFERSDDLELGICDVSIPKEHRIGHLESPSFWKLDFRHDPSRHVVLQRVRPLTVDDFHGRLHHDVGESVRHELLVFVHGFNVTFEDAARRAAQIAYDLEFGGPAIMYSWPSRGKLSPAAYRHDSANAAFTVAHLRQFLQAIGERSGATAIHLIAHSMGNQALTNALKEISLTPPAPALPISEVILTAPDIDAGVFRHMADEFRKVAQRVTLYVSANDRALHFSKKYQGNFVRVGDCSTELFVFPGIDSIDVSAVDSNLVGHFYYGDNKSVLSDVFYLIKNRTPADERFGLIEQLRGGQRCWVFRP